MTIEKYEKAQQLRNDINGLSRDIDRLSEMTSNVAFTIGVDSFNCDAAHFHTKNTYLTEKVISLLHKELTLQRNKLEAEFKKL